MLKSKARDVQDNPIKTTEGFRKVSLNDDHRTKDLIMGQDQSRLKSAHDILAHIRSMDEALFLTQNVRPNCNVPTTSSDRPSVPPSFEMTAMSLSRDNQGKVNHPCDNVNSAKNPDVRDVAPNSQVKEGGDDELVRFKDDGVSSDDGNQAFIEAERVWVIRKHIGLSIEKDKVAIQANMEEFLDQKNAKKKRVKKNREKKRKPAALNLGDFDSSL